MILKLFVLIFEQFNISLIKFEYVLNLIIVIWNFGIICSNIIFYLLNLNRYNRGNLCFIQCMYNYHIYYNCDHLISINQNDYVKVTRAYKIKF